MNYRHAFHAGNFADCFKHAILVWCIRAMQRKDRPVLFLDTHAGIGRYDLSGAEASRTAYSVGYESASQFSREYARAFGTPPSRDAERLRGMVQVGAAV